jgi:hypothetical protein
MSILPVTMVRLNFTKLINYEKPNWPWSGLTGSGNRSLRICPETKHGMRPIPVILILVN